MKELLFSKIEGKSNQTLLVLHGFLGMSDNWKSLAAQYSLHGFEVHLLDMRNHGRSFHSEIFDYDCMVEDVLHYCLTHQLSNICLIGHSMGGKVAQFLATKHPHLIKKLVVVDIAPKYYAPHHQMILDGLNAVDFSVKPSRSDVESILLPYITDFGTRQFLLKNLFWKTPVQLDFRFNLAVLTTQIEQIGKALTAFSIFEKPTLFLRGQNSNYIQDADFDNIKSHFPKAKISTISNAGHWIQAENPKDFFEETMAFFN